jgi:hypothetical protein
VSERDRRLVEQAGELERGTREQGIGPTDHDAHVEAIPECDHFDPGAGWDT